MNSLVNKILNFTNEHTPEILIGTGVVGMATSTVLAVKATPKATELMEDKKAELGVTYLTKREMVEVTWKEYAPSVILSVLSAGVIILGTSKSVRRTTAIATVYALSENTLREFKNKTKEVVGEEKVREIEKEVSRTLVKQQPTVIETRDSEYIITTGNGDTLVYDSLSGRYFRSSVNAIERACNSINHSLMSDHFMTVNDFYNELDIPTIGAGGMIGWKSDKEMMEIGFDSDVDKIGNPYLVLTYYNRPVPLYSYSEYY